MRALSYQPPSSWRTSRRMTSSRVFVLPVMLTLRTYTRRPGSMKNVNAATAFSRSISGTAFTLAKA